MQFEVSAVRIYRIVYQSTLSQELNKIKIGRTGVHLREMIQIDVLSFCHQCFSSIGEPGNLKLRNRTTNRSVRKCTTNINRVSMLCL